MIDINRKNTIILQDLSNNELTQLFHNINVTPLTFRTTLNIPDNITFGNEIEVNDISEERASFFTSLFNDIYNLQGNDIYKVHPEETADAEIVTPRLTNKAIHWTNFKEMYETLSDTGATIGYNTASHVHIGTNLIDTPQKLSLLLKTLVVFEPIIFKFGYGEVNEPRGFLQARLKRSIFSPMMSPSRVKNFTNALDHYKYNDQNLMTQEFYYFISPELTFRPVFNFKDFDFFKLHDGKATEPNNSDHIEVRCFNGTLNPEISQNNINLMTSIVDAVINGTIDEKYINTEYAKYKKKRYNFDTFCAILYDKEKVEQYNRLLNGFNKIKLDKALKLSDMIFKTDLDKCYFLKQYLKLFDADIEYVNSLVK